MSSRPWFHVWESFLPSPPRIPSKHQVEYLPQGASIYDIWLLSRRIPGEEKESLLVSGAQRRFTTRNLHLAYLVLTGCTLSFLKKIWSNHPCRTAMMVSFNIVRSLFPAFRGYSQALIIDEVQTLIASGACTWSRLLSLIGTELIRRYLEGFIESIAIHNDNIVLGSARFFVEREQMRQRVTLDIPTQEDPQIRDLLRESELFARSFHGGGFGSLTPLDFFQILGNMTEIISHLFLVAAMTKTLAHFGILLFSLCSVALPTLISQTRINQEQHDDLYSPREARAADRREKMRNLAYCDAHRPEVLLFGLEDWILKSWSSAWKVVFDSELSQSPLQLPLLSSYHFSEMFYALQNIPFFVLVQSSSTSLGSLVLYRSSIQSIVFGLRALFTTTRMIFQSVFLLSAFCASMEVKPKLQPRLEEKTEYRSASGGARIQVRNLSYTYPGSDEPALKNVNFTLDAGETLAIVGYNGSGKSTLAKVLLRIFDFEGQLLVNDIDIRRYDPAEYHKHTTAVFQGFSKFNSTVRENVGLGYVDAITCPSSVKAAIHLAEADAIVDNLPKGLQTMLETPGFESLAYLGTPQSTRHHGLSGGEWQRLALARAFMRANNPDVDLLVFDEPTSSLDPHAQTQIFDTIHRVSRTPDGARSKTVIFITHRLSTARRADKVAMMESGTISEFGTHEELLKLNGSYASLYNQSI
ncbi:xenobiotic-transporting atpase [Moniliophthora roreri MCA 2997]|uniref:Xenobiotic-transporting atpase n=1 Tax=Moniliophthora roreri (strain MCA 2997) TaxID=1381753 RepID=V2XML3_MONRO|nr:xenobiotic-transporting atpase [Moniliophthora roreri MCA 2997]